MKNPENPPNGRRELSPRRWTRIEAILDRALDMDPGGWSDFLDDACRGEPELRREVEDLLARRPALDDFLKALPVETGLDFESAVPDPASFEGRRIGPYRIVQEIARGGMGWVFLAERADGLFHRRVAVKLLRPALDDAEMFRRFEAERRVLAGLEHPGIARLLDAGVTEEGRPYLVTEYVEGLPLHRYCRERRIPVGGRIRLFRQVAEAVHYAHRNLLVHRDLKPSNILVAADGRAKLLDFGIAKVLDQAFHPGVVTETGPGRRWMTPGYAAPEQITQGAVTTATDVYQLGVLLYELLTGRRPFQDEENALHRLERSILEAEPAPPSRAVAGDLPPRSAREIDADLDAVVLKALQKNPEDRYPSVLAMVDDLDRHRSGRPVLARKGSRWQRARKFVRRRRMETVAAVAVAAALLAGAGAAAWQAGEAARERDEAEVALARAQDVTDALVQLLESLDPFEGEVGDARATRRLLQVGTSHAEALDGQPLVQAGLLEVLARLRLRFDEMDEAEAMARRALALRREVSGPEAVGVAESLNTLALVMKHRGRYADGDALHAEALALQTRNLGEGHLSLARTLTLMASRRADGDFARAEALHRQALEIREEALGPSHPLTVESLRAVGRILRARGALVEARAVLAEAVERSRSSLGPAHPEVARGMLNLADVMKYLGDLEAAEPLYRSALEIQRKTFGEDFPGLTHGMGNLAHIHSERGEHAAAEGLLREALDLRLRVFGPEHRAVAVGMGHLATELFLQGRLDEAEQLRRNEVALLERVVGPDHWDMGGALVGLAEVLADRGRLDEAEALLLRAVEIRSAARGETTATLGPLYAGLGRLEARRGNVARAEALYRRGLDLLLEEHAFPHPDVQDLGAELADLYASRGRHQEARSLMVALQGG